MRDNPIHTFFQVLSGNIPDQLNLGGYRWFEVVLLLGISDREPRYRLYELADGCDTAHRRASQHLCHAAGQCRHVVSRHAMEAAAAGISRVRNWLGSADKYGSFQIHASIMQVFLDHIALVQPLVFLLETAICVSLMLGIAVRLAGIVGDCRPQPADWLVQRPDRMALDLCRHHLRPRHVFCCPGGPQPWHRQPARQTPDPRLPLRWADGPRVGSRVVNERRSIPPRPTPGLRGRRSPGAEIRNRFRRRSSVRWLSRAGLRSQAASSKPSSC